MRSNDNALDLTLRASCHTFPRHLTPELETAIATPKAASSRAKAATVSATKSKPPLTSLNSPPSPAFVGRGAVEMLGGWTRLEHKVETYLDAHELLKGGLPAGALHYLVERVDILHDEGNFTAALGMSPRTRQRKSADRSKRLSREQSGRAWKFAEVLSRATDIFGSQKGAEDWLVKPAMALDRRTPLELLDTTAGAELVDDLLTRLDFGVYT
jgi:putative toxin-antitoxin system antitoxin component (TIGR02293 family)